MSNPGNPEHASTCPYYSREAAQGNANADCNCTGPESNPQGEPADAWDPCNGKYPEALSSPLSVGATLEAEEESHLLKVLEELEITVDAHAQAPGHHRIEEIQALKQVIIDMFAARGAEERGKG